MFKFEDFAKLEMRMAEESENHTPKGSKIK